MSRSAALYFVHALTYRGCLSQLREPEELLRSVCEALAYFGVHHVVESHATCEGVGHALECTMWWRVTLHVKMYVSFTP